MNRQMKLEWALSSFWAPNGTRLSARCHFTVPKKLSISRAQPPPTSSRNGCCPHQKHYARGHRCINSYNISEWRLIGKASFNVQKFYSLPLNKLFVYAHKQATQDFSISTPHKYGLSSNLQQISSGLLLTRETNHMTSIRECCACASRDPIIHEVTSTDQLQPRGVKQHPLIRTYTCIWVHQWVLGGATRPCAARTYERAKHPPAYRILGKEAANQ